MRELKPTELERVVGSQAATGWVPANWPQLSLRSIGGPISQPVFRWSPGVIPGPVLVPGADLLGAGNMPGRVYPVGAWEC